VPSLGIVIALPAEARSLDRRRVDFASQLELAGGHWLCISGAGPERASEAARALIERRVDGLVSWGCAAALAEHLRPGHLVLADMVRGADDECHVTDAAWRGRLAERLPRRLRQHAGVLQESRRVIATHAEKRSLHGATGSLAVDMESAAIARAAQSSGLPFLAVRAIADHAAMNLPAAVLKALNPRGDVRMGVLLAHIARRPREIPELMALGRAFGAAMRTLGEVRAAAGPHFGFPYPPQSAPPRQPHE
jgi:adenosylhomocysteine nucleosidase